MRHLSLVAAFSMLSGCMFTGASAQETLRDAVVGINDEIRWNRMDLAVQRVTPGYRGEFRATHHDWHREIEIADSEIVHVEMGAEREEAASIVTFRWYRYSSMTLEETTIRQHWEKVPGGYLLTEEMVVEGEDALLEIPVALRDPEELEADESTDDESVPEAADDDAEPAVEVDAEVAREREASVGLI